MKYTFVTHLCIYVALLPLEIIILVQWECLQVHFSHLAHIFIFISLLSHSFFCLKDPPWQFEPVLNSSVAKIPDAFSVAACH